MEKSALGLARNTVFFWSSGNIVDGFDWESVEAYLMYEN